MFVDRQSIFSSLFSLKLLTLSFEIRRFQAANIGKIKKTTTFFIKKLTFFSKKQAQDHRFRGKIRQRRRRRLPLIARIQRASLKPNNT